MSESQIPPHPPMLILVRVYNSICMASCISNPRARRRSDPQPYWAAHACAKYHFAGAPFHLREASDEEIPEETSTDESFGMPDFQVKARHWYVAELLSVIEARNEEDE